LCEGQLSWFDNEKAENTLVLQSHIKQDEITKQVANSFDYEFDGTIIEEIVVPDFPSQFQIGLIVGSSGSGKTTILHESFGTEEKIVWDSEKCIASHFKDINDASNRLGAVGLNSIPSWLKPYRVLSNGEKFRADMARRLKNNAVIDEFTSVVNREVAASCSMSIEKYIRRNNLHNIVFCSCHLDIIEYLKPDWVYNTDTHEFYNGRYLQRPEIEIKVSRCGKDAWDMFKRYHYLSGSLNKAAVCYVGTYHDIPVCFGAILPLPSGTMKHAFREHRIVVLPDYQGMGIGNKFSEMLGEAYRRAGCRYFCKTANPRMGQHRDNSPLWKTTSKNHVLRPDYIKQQDHDYHNMLHNALVHVNRDCFSHEYIGDGKQYEFSYGSKNKN